MNHKSTTQRNLSLDAVRGIGIILMIIYHFVFDLDHFDFIDVPIFTDIKYKLWRYVIMNLFLIPVGIGMVLAYGRGINWGKLKKRLIMLGSTSILITIVSIVVFPENWIYFGIIHFIFLSTILALFFLPYPRFSLTIAIIILVLNASGILITRPFFDFIWEYLPFLPYYSNDTVRFFPWFAAVLIGIFLGHYKIHEYIQLKGKIIQQLAFLGRHSMFIYLTHQLILFNSVWAISMLI